MKRIDVIVIGIVIFAAGGLGYVLLQLAGLDSAKAGIWSQVLLFGGSIGWLLTYLFRVGTKQMTYNQQVKDYKEAVLQKKLEAMTPEEVAQMQADIEREKQSKTAQQE
jgi:hypothetical protein